MFDHQTLLFLSFHYIIVEPSPLHDMHISVQSFLNNIARLIDFIDLATSEM